MTVTETLHLSKVTSLYNTILGELPTPAGIGEDIVTELTVTLDMESVVETFVAGDDSAGVVVLQEIDLPEGTGCVFPVEP